MIVSSLLFLSSSLCISPEVFPPQFLEKVFERYKLPVRERPDLIRALQDIKPEIEKRVKAKAFQMGVGDQKFVISRLRREVEMEILGEVTGKNGRDLYDMYDSIQYEKALEQWQCSK